MRTAAEGRGPHRARVIVAPRATATSLGVIDRNDPIQDSPFGFFCIRVPLTARAGELGCGSCGGESGGTSGGGCASRGFPGGGSTEYSESTSEGSSGGISGGYSGIGSGSECGTLGCSGLGNSGSPGYSGDASGGYSGYSSSGYSPSGSNGYSEVGHSDGGFGGYLRVVSTGYSAGGSGAYVGAGSNGYSAGESTEFSHSGSGRYSGSAPASSGLNGYPPNGSGRYPESGSVGYHGGGFSSGIGSGTWIGIASPGNIQRRPSTYSTSGFGSGSGTWTSTSFSSGNLANRPGTGRLIGCLTNKPGECGGATVGYQNGGSEDSYGSGTYSTVSPVSSNPEEMQIYQIDIRSNIPPRK